MEVTQSKIEEIAPNAEAVKNGRDLEAKGKFSNLHISPDKSLIWGECAGSGKNPYYCSADYVDENNPVFRCSCPSRQLPCKHAIGLLCAYEKNSVGFEQADVPDDIVQKRAKIEKRQEKKTEVKATVREKAEKPKKINASALIKKADAQLSGIELANKLLNEIVQTGLSSFDAKVIKTLQGQVKELGNYHINGIQTAFTNFFLELGVAVKSKDKDYIAVIDSINYISALLKKAVDYLNKRKEDPEADPELDSAIEEQIGYVWKLPELMQYGLYEENAELLQLSFNSYDNSARKEFVDEGIWINMKSGRIHKTKNYRPYRATKFIEEEDTQFDMLQLKELFIYPGDRNPRVRWEKEAMVVRATNSADFRKVYDFSTDNYQEMLKSVKNTIKNPLMDKNPVVLIKLHKVFVNGENLIAEDPQGNRLTLHDLPEHNIASTVNLQLFLPAMPEKMALAVMINNDISTGLLYAQPLCLLTPEKIIRLLY